MKARRGIKHKIYVGNWSELLDKINHWYKRTAKSTRTTIFNFQSLAKRAFGHSGILWIPTFWKNLLKIHLILQNVPQTAYISPLRVTNIFFWRVCFCKEQSYPLRTVKYIQGSLNLIFCLKLKRSQSLSDDDTGIRKAKETKNPSVKSNGLPVKIMQHWKKNKIGQKIQNAQN